MGGVVEVTITSRGGAEITLDVDYKVSGEYRRAKTDADPDSCYEAEYPKVDLRDKAQLTLKNGKVVPYNLRKLTVKERTLIEESILSYVTDRRDDYDHVDEPDYDDYEVSDGP